MDNTNFEQKILERMSALEQRVDKLENGGSKTVNAHGVAKKLSIKEFIMTKKLDDDVKRTLAIAYFIEHMENTKPFNTEDLKKAFRLAKISLPLNINDKINMNIRVGRIMEAEEKKDSKKAWELTATGETFVENELNK
ncbi:MAG: hypothetical protein A2735_00285 [Candidatus Yanofskybacteria bacterium RIFCSPHIGHO2_01_FULL_41_21]|uniref:Uncharacterized protein n=1 Tax=Candidatus Yanofskybacteria bacterium RIFCSPHIGHO2_01_FULL_41_21 TaxID=1802660 RepID=A0A1F8EBG3_9BACT|nr:MAG: hypothetical protein A2735_00285 [Candidatus Yanofskybacteria bacterium RIFCSPHIGHO2_01_FULL_41_21]